MKIEEIKKPDLMNIDINNKDHILYLCIEFSDVFYFKNEVEDIEIDMSSHIVKITRRELVDDSFFGKLYKKTVMRLQWHVVDHETLRWEACNFYIDGM